MKLSQLFKSHSFESSPIVSWRQITGPLPAKWGEQAANCFVHSKYTFYKVLPKESAGGTWSMLWKVSYLSLTAYVGSIYKGNKHNAEAMLLPSRNWHAVLKVYHRRWVFIESAPSISRFHPSLNRVLWQLWLKTRKNLPKPKAIAEALLA